MTTTVTFTQRGVVYAIRFPYSPTLVELIKTVVPHYSRSWDPVTKEWTIDAVVAPLLAESMRQLGHQVVGIETSRRREDHDPDDTSRWAHQLFKRIGPARAPLAYRLLSKLCHPDHGGDHQLQLELNQAYAELPDRRRTA